MNPLLLPVIIGTFSCFFVGIWLARRAQSWIQNLALAATGFVAAMPALLFAGYYTGILGEAAWFYSFRAAMGTEFAACGIGLLAGCLQVWRAQSLRVSKQMSQAFLPFLLLLCVAIPYLKQIFLRPEWKNFSDRWSENVCLQSSESSCGPASAATLLKFFGKPASEKQIAQESFTSRRGTENWYLVRTLQRHGLMVRYEICQTDKLKLSIPAIVGVRLGAEGGSGHFIAILGKDGDYFVVGDPLIGREKLTEMQLRGRYFFTGFSIAVSTNLP